MENKLFNVPVDLFQLEKLVLNKNKTCKVWYKIIDDRGDKTETINGFMEPNWQTVNAFQKKLEELKEYLCELRHIKDDGHEKVSVTGVIWKGEGKSEAFSILGVNKSDSEKNMKCDSAVENIGVEKYSFEMKIRDIIIELESFAHGYIFEGKKADISLGLKPVDNEITDVEIEEVIETEE